MPAAVKDIKIETGMTFTLSVRYPRDVPTPMAIGWLAHMQVREEAEDAVIIVDASTQNGRILLQDVNPIAVPGDTDYYNIRILIPSDITLPLIDGVFKYDLVIGHAADTYRKRLLRGDAMIVRSVTHD